MRKFLLAAAVLAPFAAFAEQPSRNSRQIAGDVAQTTSGSFTAISSRQGTSANSMVSGIGAVTNGAVAGNYTAIDTTGGAQAGRKGTFTSANAVQLNMGGAIIGGLTNEGRPSGSASAMQNSQVIGGSAAAAANLGGFGSRSGRH